MCRVCVCFASHCIRTCVADWRLPDDDFVLVGQNDVSRSINDRWYCCACDDGCCASIYLEQTKDVTDSRGSIESENGSNAFQLNVYCWILEAAYGRTVGERMYFAVVHEDLPKPRLVKISHLQEELEALITDQLKKGLAVSRVESDEA